MNKKKIRNFLLLIFIVAPVIFTLTACSGGSYSAKTKTCGSCGRTFEAGDAGGNFMSISRTGMCTNCYNNYKYATGR